MALTPRLHLIAIGGAHQLPHFLPPALELAEQDRIELVLWTPDDSKRGEITDFVNRIGYHLPETRILTPHRLFAYIGFNGKAAQLLLNAADLRDCDVILCAERTSTLLKRLPGHCPPMIHIPHGAGDRAVGFEKRIKLFDQVLVMGPKDLDRMVEEGVIEAGQCDTIGPVKLASMALIPDRRELFANERKTALYNPHFDPELGTYDTLGWELANWFAQQDRYNLIFAPHVRLKERLGPAEIARWNKLAELEHVIVDFGSRNSVDMTYTLGADLYIGDVSSQVYEFIARPRPCLFLNPHKLRWENDPNYAMWRFGRVINKERNFGQDIEQVISDFAKYKEVQQQALLNAYGVGPEAWENREQARKTIANAARTLDRAINRCLPSDQSTRSQSRYR